MQRNLNTSPGMGTRRRVDAANGEHAGRPFSDMGNILPWFKVELLQVANDLSDVKSLEAEGAYFRLLRHLWMNGPQTREQLQRKFHQAFNEIEHLLTPVQQTSTGVEQVLTSVPWLEQQRAQVDTWRENKRKAGLESARVRSSKPKRSNRRQQLLNTSQQPTLTHTLSLTHNTQGEKERASDERKTLFANCAINDLEAMKAAFPELVAEGVDMEHYRDAIRNWSDTKDEKRSARGWSATVRQWTKTDRDKGELKKINAAFPVKGPLTAATAKAWADRIRADKGLAPGSALGFEEMPIQLREFYMR